MFDKQTVADTIASLGITDFAGATIRDMQSLARRLEDQTGERVIHLEMGVPGLPSPAVGIEAEVEALRGGCAAIYPPTAGIPRLAEAASRFVSTYIGVSVAPQNVCATVGSMQGTFAVMTALRLARPDRDTVLFVDPGFSVQKTHAEVIGLKQVSFDVHHCRGRQLVDRMEQLLRENSVACIIYSNPNNPSWICLSEEELEGIGRLATKYDAVVLEDLAYFAMDFRRDIPAVKQSTVARYTDNYILAISGSKAFSYAGQRIGVLAIGDALAAREFEATRRQFGVARFGAFLPGRILYTLSSGVAHSAQHALAAMMEAAVAGRLDFITDVKEYGRRAAYMKDVFLSGGFSLVYPDDLGEPLADGFYFTVGYPGMTGPKLARELFDYGIATFPLDTMGSREQGVRICTSFFGDDLRPAFAERIAAFHRDHC